MDWGNMSVEKASALAGWLWDSLLLVWVLMWFGMKKAKKLESPWEMAQHALPVILGFWLLFGSSGQGRSAPWLPMIPAVWVTGLLLTAVGVGTSICARVTLGANWSGVVTLKKGHELIGKGLYRRIRHPIYTGILVAMMGTALIKGRLRGWIGFAIVWAAFYWKARREESLLHQEFGADFEEHSRRTGRFFPKWI
jgi:protein-S-isoprenylcysteine O-methyltransferase Ste14